MITIQSGSINIENVTSAYKEVNIKFPKPFKEAPSVQISLRGASLNRFINLVTDSIKPTEFKVAAYVTSGTGNVGVTWTAIGK